MASVSVSEGTIRVHRSIAGTGAAFRVAFVPYAEGDDAKTAVALLLVNEMRLHREVLAVDQMLARRMEMVL